MQYHHIQNLSNNDYIFHGFLNMQQQKLNLGYYIHKRFVTVHKLQVNFMI